MTPVAPYRPPARPGGRPLLRTALGRRGVTEAVLDGLTPPGFDLDLHDVQPLPRAFRLMVNERTYHVAEMALVTLAMAIEHGRPIVGLPAVLNRDFHYRSIVVRTGGPVRTPADLAGRRVGVRAYSQTTGVWVRGLLAEEYGLAPDAMTWVTFEPAHVAEYADPPHVERAPAGASMLELLAAGALDAAVIMDPQVDPAVARPLFPDAAELARRAYAGSGIFPVNHVVAVDTGLVEEFPAVVPQLYDLFLHSRARYVERLGTTGPRTPADHHALALGDIVVGDVNPFGAAANRAAHEQLLRFAHDQGLLRDPMSPDALFHPALD